MSEEDRYLRNLFGRNGPPPGWGKRKLDDRKKETIFWVVVGTVAVCLGIYMAKQEYDYRQWKPAKTPKPRPEPLPHPGWGGGRSPYTSNDHHGPHCYCYRCH